MVIGWCTWWRTWWWWRRKCLFLSGSELCSYELAGHKYPGIPDRFSKCPKLPVPPRWVELSSQHDFFFLSDLEPELRPVSVSHSKPLPVFNRCTPLDISCYAKFAEAVVTFVSDDSVLHRLVAGVAASKEIIIGLCVLALGESGCNGPPVTEEQHVMWLKARLGPYWFFFKSIFDEDNTENFGIIDYIFLFFLFLLFI